MTKKQILDTLMLLSAIESWGLSSGSKMPDYLSDQLLECVEVLRNEVLK